MWACFTLQEMGKGDNSKSRTTREFDAARLAALTRQPLPDEVLPQIERAARGTPPPQDDAAPELALGRTKTLDDPMTTGLLAEVARRSQTTDFDEDLIQEVLEKIDSGETNHPHTRRRSSK